MNLTEVEKAWLKTLESFNLIYLVRDKWSNVLKAYSAIPKLYENDGMFWYGNTEIKQADNLIDKSLFKFVDTKTVFKIYRNNSGELDLVALKGENLWTMPGCQNSENSAKYVIIIQTAS